MNYSYQNSVFVRGHPDILAFDPLYFPALENIAGLHVFFAKLANRRVEFEVVVEAREEATKLAYELVAVRQRLGLNLHLTEQQFLSFPESLRIRQEKIEVVTDIRKRVKL